MPDLLPHKAILQQVIAFERVVLTPYTFVTVFLPAYLGYYALAVLVQLPHTSLYRAALLPAVFWTAFRANMSLDLAGSYPELAAMNQWLAFGMFVISMRSTVWTFANQPFTRLPISEMENGTPDGKNETTSTERDVSLPSAMWNAWDLTVNFRNIGWVGPQKIRVPTPYLRVESRPMFFLVSLCWLMFLLLAFDALGIYVRSLGLETFGAPEGGTIFDPALPPLQRYMKSSMLSLFFGFAAYLVIDANYYFHAVLYTALFQQYPSQWPPLFSAPWLSTSLSSFWGRRWHQLFREPFSVVGGRPLEMVFGRVGTVFGAFILSGMLHDIGLQGVGRGADTLPVTGFFFLQGVGVLIEYYWRKATGKRVGGFFGWLWTIAWLTAWGQLMVDAWARKGLLGSRLWPSAYRPSTYILNWLAGVNESL